MLAAEVMVQSAFGQPGTLNDLVGGRGVVSFLREELSPCAYQRRASIRSVPCTQPREGLRHYSTVPNVTTCPPRLANCSSASCAGAVVLMHTPNGVGQPRSACTIDRNATRVVAAACHPDAQTMQPTARPWK